MIGMGIVFAVGLCAGGMTTVSGHVLDGAGAPVARARVFIEPGLGEALVEAPVSPDGEFRFEEVPPGGVGVFAVAEGHAFGGQHVLVGIEDALAAVTIRLLTPDSLGGKALDHKGQPVAGARITRVGLLGTTKVGIPLAKLKAYGLEEPVSGEDGRFTVSRLPRGGVVALKVSHPEFAQQGVDNVPVGEEEVRVNLYPGVLLRGVVRSHREGAPVLNASILVRNAQPPYDTAVTSTDASGRFALRLNPGVYLYQAAGAAYRSAGWRQLTVTNATAQQELSLAVVGVGMIGGSVRDAISGKPVAGARVVVEANGHVADVLRTGRTGAFQTTATEGENTVRLEPVPGYQVPETATQRVSVGGGESVEVPAFWLAPIPTYTVRVVDGAMAATPGAVVQLLRPPQFGWRVTDAEGCVSLQVAALPADGVIVGTAEHPVEPFGAVFALRREDADGAKVQLLPLGRVTGHVATAKGRAVSGAVVGGAFAGDLSDGPLWLWRTLTREDGAFGWDAVVPHVPQQCVVAAGNDTTGESTTFNLDPSSEKDLGALVVSEAATAATVCGKTLKWYDNPLVAGSLPDKDTCKNGPAWIVYCRSEDAAAVVEGLTVACDILGREDMVFAVVVRGGGYEGDAPAIPVLTGEPPAAATTYLVGANGKVVLETFGMPPVHIVRRLSRP